jgi:hypothetical protein
MIFHQVSAAKHGVPQVMTAMTRERQRIASRLLSASIHDG